MKKFCMTMESVPSHGLNRYCFVDACYYSCKMRYEWAFGLPELKAQFNFSDQNLSGVCSHRFCHQQREL